MMLKLAFLLVAFSATNAIDLESVTEKQCYDLTPKLDLEWFEAQKTFYFPLMDKLDIWAFARDARGEAFANEKSAEEIVKLGCSTWGAGHHASFFGSPVSYDVVITNEEFVFKKKNSYGEDQWRRFRFEFTDNKSFVFGTNCFDNGKGRAGWVLLSTTPFLTHENQKRIIQRIESLGFYSNNIVKPPNHRLCKYEESYPATEYAYPDKEEYPYTEHKEYNEYNTPAPVY